MIGTKLYGFCGGYFGRDSYHDKIIVAYGDNWMVSSDIDDVKHVEFATFDNIDDMWEHVKEWKVKKEDDL